MTEYICAMTDDLETVSSSNRAAAPEPLDRHFQPNLHHPWEGRVTAADVEHEDADEPVC